MSKIPDTKKPKYNNHDAFRWVDSQWEKFMTEQKEHRAIIKQLQEDLGTCTKNFQTQRKQMEELVSRVPSTFLTNMVKEYPNDKELGNAVRELSWEQVKEDDNQISTQLEMFLPNDVY